LSDDLENQPSVAWQKQFSGLFRIQFLTALIASFFVWVWQDEVMAISFLSGGILVGLNSVLLARSVVGSSRSGAVDGRGALYRSAAIRFLLLVFALIGANLMGLHLLAVAAGMFTAYVGGYIYIVKSVSQTTALSDE